MPASTSFQTSVHPSHPTLQQAEAPSFLCESEYGLKRLAPHEALSIAVIGTGYVGLVSGVCLAAVGHEVIGIDTNTQKILALQEGHTPLYEMGLPALQQEAQRHGNLRFSHTLEEALTQTKLCMLAVGTPQQEDGSADLSALYAVVETIIEHYHRLKEAFKPQVLIVKSTVPVGTCLALQARLTAAGVGLEVISNPEFLKQGVAVSDFMNPERVLVGSLWGEHPQGEVSPYLDKLMRRMYAPWLHHPVSPVPYVHISRHSAEMAKYACNAFLATKISFMNEMATLCEAMGADVEDVQKVMGLDERIGAKFLQSGIGYGGSCFPKDVRALEAMGQTHQCDTLVLSGVDETNRRQPLRFLQRLEHKLPHQSFHQTRIALWGLAFKPDTDDMREAPSIPIVAYLLSHGAEVHVYDPQATSNAQRIFQTLFKPEAPASLHYHTSALEALTGADALLLLTEWQTFKTIPATEVLARMRGRWIADGRRALSAETYRKLGFHVLQVGR
jgi:UDPglucose 6-dehydrogenase